MTTLPLAQVAKPSFDWAAFSPLLAILGGAVIVLVAGLARGRFVRRRSSASSPS
jgi:NADH-quinone oxidoreductase subunit N